MTKDEEHALKMNFIRQFQGAVPVKRRRAPATSRRGGRAYRDTSRGDESLSLSVHPDVVNEARALTKAAGLSGIAFKNDGTCVVTDEKHKQKYARLIGMGDFNSRNGS